MTTTSKRLSSLALAALLGSALACLTGPAAAQKKGGGGGGTTSPTPTGPVTGATLAGQAHGVRGSVELDIGSLGSLLGSSRTRVDIGPIPYVKLPPAGGADVESLANVAVFDLARSATLFNAVSGGTGLRKAGTDGVSVIENLSLLGGLIQATALGSFCSSHSNASLAGSSAHSELLGLRIGGQALSASTAPNTRIDLLASNLLGIPTKVGEVVINEQVYGGDGVKTSTVTTNALAVRITNPNVLSLLVGKTIAGDITVASVTCGVNVNNPGGPGGPNQPPAETDAFMTGGGRIGTGATLATFGFNARAGRGQLQYVDHGAAKLNVHSESIDSFRMTNLNCSEFGGHAKVNGTSGYTYTAQVCDFAEPGTGTDTFAITVNGLGSGPYSRSGTLSGGNIQAHN